MEPLKYIRWPELLIDSFMIIDITLVFFTAEVNDDCVERSIKNIALSYLKTYFFPDCLACLPGLVILENVSGPNQHLKWVYYFKIIRYL